VAPWFQQLSRRPGPCDSSMLSNIYAKDTLYTDVFRVTLRLAVCPNQFVLAQRVPRIRNRDSFASEPLLRSRKPRLRSQRIHRTDHASPLYPQKLALTSPTSGGRSVGIVRSQTQATELV
jgi:hypothetical protein